MNHFKAILFLFFFAIIMASCGNSRTLIPLEDDISETKFSKETTMSDSDTDHAESSVAADTLAPQICVSIIGEINNPGVYYLPYESRIYELINEAGGITESADMKDINLVYILSDGMQITIPAVSDGTASDSSQGEIPTVIMSGNRSDGSTQSTNKVNINTAGLSELTTLTGIGQTRAEAIIEYREANGNFASVEDIMNVAGIKEGTYAKIKDRICVK